MSMRKLAIVNALMFSALTIVSNMPMFSSIPSMNYGVGSSKYRKGSGRNFTPKAKFKKAKRRMQKKSRRNNR